eukprot:ANDGO_03440.mRNA.1 hypothetical protein AMSG_05897
MGNSASKKGEKWEAESTDNGPCQAKACAIQFCLADNAYKQEACKDAIQAFQECVKKHASSEREAGKS